MIDWTPLKIIYISALDPLNPAQEDWSGGREVQTVSDHSLYIGQKPISEQRKDRFANIRQSQAICGLSLVSARNSSIMP